MAFQCIYCKKIFTSKSILKNHQKSAKYCLKIQEKTDIVDEDENDNNYTCEYCNKSFTSNFRFQQHLEICLSKYKCIAKNKEVELQLIIKEMKIIKKENLFLKEEIKTIRIKTELEFYKQNSKENQSTINEIAKQPRTTNNNQKVLITTPMDLSQPVVQQAIQQGFSEEYLVQGQKGVARFAVDNILKDKQGKLKYVCTDPSRQIFQYKNEDGSMQKDVRATKLTKALLDGELKSTSHKIAWDNMKDGGDQEFQSYTDYYYEIKDMETDNSEFSKELSSLTV
jgi:hypothetical protein